ncbi:MAG: TonB-dependent receptor [Bacteroidales bacterium]|nr:TonB-dependent receptor [Bacteroidales bacterium]
MIVGIGFSGEASAKRQQLYDIDLTFTSGNLKTVAAAITKQTGLLFSYESDLASKAMGTISIHKKQAGLDAILSEVFSNKGIDYKVINKTVVLTVSAINEVDDSKVTVKGKITDQAGEPLIGAGVMVKGTSKGVTSDIDGNYVIEARRNQTLLFSFIGFTGKEIPIEGNDIINVVLDENRNILNDAVVIGYGTQSRRSLTTSIAKVDGSAIYDAPVSSVGDALKGKVSGLRVATNNNVAGGVPRMLIRGGSSISLSNDPIVIVDGVTRSINNINPNDIESIEVLKDAASAGIYGARASNGVILVTTKKGNAYRKPEITFDSQAGFESPSRSWNLMNSREFIGFVRPALVNSYNGAAILAGANAAGTGNTMSNSPYTTRYLNKGEEVPDGYEWMYDPVDKSKVIIFTNTNYQKQWFKNAFWHKEYVGVNGGSKNMRYAASMSYLDDDGIVAMGGYKIFTMHGNTTFDVTKHLTASTTFDFSRSKQAYLAGNYFNAVGRGLMMGPTHRDYDDEGHWITGGTNANQQTASFYENFYDRERANNDFTGNFNLKWKITDGLSATAQYAVTDLNYRGSYYAYGEVNGTPNYISSTRSTSETRTETLRDSFTAYLTYAKTFDRVHKIDATAGYDFMKWRYLSLTANATGSVSDKVPILDSGVNFTASNEDTGQALMSYFGRVNYEYDGRYILSGTIRADGSSKFADGNRWGYFPAASFGWVISEEPYWHVSKDKVGMFKFRASYGQTGNNGIGLYDTYGAYSTSNTYAGLSTTLPSSMQNKSLKWETTTQLDLGVDLNLYNDRIRFVADYYNKVTNNMLFSITLPDTGTFSSVKANVGSARFYGFELELHTANIQTHNFSWQTDLTYSFNKNRVLSLPDEYEYADINGKQAWRIGGYTLSESGYRFGGIAVGEPLGRIYGYKIDHIIQTIAEADAAYYDSQSHGYRRGDGLSVAGRKDVGDYEWCNRPGSARRSDGSEQINGEDMYKLGNVMPHSTGGINNTFHYKNLSLNIYLDYALGHSIYNYMKSRFFQNTLGNCNSNLDKMVYDCWTHPGDNAKYARFFANDADFGNRNFSRESDFNVEKADYLCIRDVSLYYDFPSKWTDRIHMKKLSVGITGNTLYYFTGVSGSVSPETGMGAGSSDSMYSVVSTSSSNGNFFPAVRKILLNVKITF